MGGKEDKFGKYDEMGQLSGGYDVFLARETAFKHARSQLSKEKSWLQGLSLEWEIRSAKFDEDEDCYKVVLECYPDDANVETKSQWEYHINATGNLYPGTPRLVSKGKWIADLPKLVEKEQQRIEEQKQPTKTRKRADKDKRRVTKERRRKKDETARKRAEEEKREKNIRENRPAKSHFPWSEEEREAVAKEYESGLSINELATKFERSPTSIGIQLVDKGLLDSEALNTYKNSK